MIKKNNLSKKNILLRESEKLNHFNEEYFTQLGSTSTEKHELDRKVINQITENDYSVKVEYVALLMAEETYPEDDLKRIWKHYQCDKIDHAPDVENQSTPEKRARIWIYLLYRFIGWGSQAGLDVLNKKDRLKLEATENEELKPETIRELINTINKKHNTHFPIPEKLKAENTETTEDGGYCFYRISDKLWQVSFEGKRATIDHTKGLSYIHYVLCCPFKQISAMKLQLIENQNPEGIKTNIYNRKIEDMVNDGSLSLSGEDKFSEQDKFTENKKKELQQEIWSLKQELETAEKNNSPDTGIIKQQLREETKLYTELNKKDNIEEENARTAVQKNIEKAKDKIKKHLPDFYKHLNDYLKTGSDISYLPDSTLPWVFKAKK